MQTYISYLYSNLDEQQELVERGKCARFFNWQISPLFYIIIQHFKNLTLTSSVIKFKFIDVFI